MIAPEHVEWCRTTFAMLKDGGVWGVPRSGLLFTKRGDTLVLSDEMPHEATMPISVDELREQQSEEFESIRRHFEAAGITVIREVAS